MSVIVRYAHRCLTCVCSFCDAMIQIRKEAEDIITGKQPKDNNLLKNAPHPLSVISLSDKEWNRCVRSGLSLASPYSRFLQSLLSSNRSVSRSMAP